MKEKSYFKNVPPNLPPKGSRCDGCPYGHGIGGAAGWYFKIYRPKKQQATDAAEDYGDDYDDTPPWEDEDETESEGEE
mgnify:CR=1 FL=1